LSKKEQQEKKIWQSPTAYLRGSRNSFTQHLALQIHSNVLKISTFSIEREGMPVQSCIFFYFLVLFSIGCSGLSACSHDFIIFSLNFHVRSQLSMYAMASAFMGGIPFLVKQSPGQSHTGVHIKVVDVSTFGDSISGALRWLFRLLKQVWTVQNLDHTLFCGPGAFKIYRKQAITACDRKFLNIGTKTPVFLAISSTGYRRQIVDISYCQKPYLAQNHGLDG
jgi:hypothetical protein